jgi:hypothetical protein
LTATDILRIIHFLTAQKIRPYRAKSIAGFPLGPLPGKLHLKISFRQVIHHAIASDMIKRLVLTDIFGGAADHHTQLNFPINLLCITWPDNRIIGTAD